MKPKVLITGGAGYIGSHAALACIDAGWPVVILDDLSTGIRSALPPGSIFVEGSAGDGDLVRQIMREQAINSVIHFAGSSVIPDSITDSNRYYRNNTSNSLTLMEVSIQAGVRSFIYSSSASVYAPAPNGTLKEDARLEPINPYGRSKLMTEQMLADAARAYALPYVALRYFNVAGADPLGRAGQSTANATHLIKVACQVALGRRPELPIFGNDYDTPDGTCVRDFIHVSDLADAHLLVLKDQLADGGHDVLNCGYGRGVSVLEVVRTLERITGSPLPVSVHPRRPGDMASVVADSSKLAGKHDWRPRHDDLGAIVASALEWERRG